MDSSTSRHCGLSITIFCLLLFCVGVVPEFTSNKKCHSSFYECDNSNCIKQDRLCDLVDDCEDNSDEIHCEKVTDNILECDEGLYPCKHPRRCFSLSDLCGEFNECNDEDTEKLCSPLECTSTEFKCANASHCIAKKYVCDTVDDCVDGSDEIDCENKIHDCRKSSNYFTCDDHSQLCLHSNFVCDGRSQCDDGSDEKNNCEELCYEMNCDHQCIPHETGAKCACDEGYALNKDEKTCYEIDYCNHKMDDDLPPCSQKCHSMFNKAYCYCIPGYSKADDDRSCKAKGSEAVLYYANVSEIWSLTFETKKSKKLIDNLTEINGLAVDANGNRIFWSEDGNNKAGVYSMNIDDNDKEKRLIISYGLVKPTGLAFDYLAGNLYIVDSALPAIIACELQDGFCAQVFNSSVVDSPKDIVVHPEQGVMYWTEVGEKPAIMKGGMNGVESEVIVSRRIKMPVSLYLDLTIDKLFWIDSSFNEVNCVNLDGSNKTVIIGHKISIPIGMVVFEDEVIWANGNTHDIMAANKFKGYDVRSLLEKVTKPTALTIGHKSLQNDMEINDCQLRHCHLCLLGPENPSCVCSEGFVPDSNFKSCKEVHSAPFLMAAVDSQIVKIDFNSEGTPMSVFKTDSLTNIFALAYLYKKHQILYAGIDDEENVFIKRLEQINNKPHSVPLLTDIKSIQSMAVDEAASTIFWIDSVKKSIKVSSLERTFRAELPVRVNHPMSLTLNPVEGSMYFADMYPASIRQCRLDGTKCFSLVTQPLEEPNYVLYWNQKLFWSDRSLQEISYIDPKTKERGLLVSTRNQPLSFAVYGSHLYWTEVGDKRIFYKDISQEDGYQSYIDTGYQNLAGLAMAVSPPHPRQNGCTINNGACDHICISGQSSISCMCSDGYHLADDGKSCTELPKCNGFLCKVEEICKDSSIKCNQVQDCLDGSDEDDCPMKSYCAADEYKCDDGQCVKNSVCDGIYDCQDKSDEKPEICPQNNGCSPEQLWCGFCLSRKHICDGSFDCENGEDEKDCVLNCTDEEFKCSNCISKDWVCDGIKDCVEGEDEVNCPTNCSGFECSNKKCIDRKEICNGFRDCDDGEDEKMNCQFTCRSDQFRCSDERCIDENFVCDNEPDCHLGEDESPSLCLNCQTDQFECSDGSCISLDKKCDGFRNCPDGLDEFNCPSSFPAECHGFRCEMGQCINQSNYCDGIMHCQDNSDETDCLMSCNKLQHCQHSCLHTRFGPQCTCKKGYQLVGKFSCEDIDECSNGNNICGHTCVNLEGAVESRGFKCECHPGFIQGTDPFFCKATGPRPQVYVSTYNNIKNLSADGQFESITISNITPPIMIDIDVRHKALYWVDEAESVGPYRSLRQELWKKSHDKQKRSLLSGHFMDLAVDWITSNIYISHIVHSEHHITILNERNYQATVVSDQPYRPREIALHPSKGLMFFVSEHRHPARLMKSSMDGMSKTIIADVLPHRKSLLALDASLDRIYWYDVYTKKMVSSDLQGNSKQHFDIPDLKVHALDVFESILYMTNFMDNSVIKFPLYGPKYKRSAEKIAHAQFPQSIKVAHVLKQPYESNPCASKQCLFMCVLTAFGSKCLCPNGIKNKTNSECRGSPVISVPESGSQRPSTGYTASPRNCTLTCLNKGQCILNGTQQICRCVPGSSGDFCEVLMESKKTEERSFVWIIGLVTALVVLVLIAIGVVCYIWRKRQHPDLIKAIRFKKSAKYIVSNNRDDTEDLVPEISFNNPGFQDEIDEEADMRNTTEWWRKLLSRSQKSVNAAFNRRGSSDKCQVMNGGMPQDPTMADKVTLLKRV